MKKCNSLKKLCYLSISSFIIASNLIATSCINNVENCQSNFAHSPNSINLGVRDELLCIVKKIQVGLKVDDFLVSGITVDAVKPQKINNSWIEKIVGELVDKEAFFILKKYSGFKKSDNRVVVTLMDSLKNFYYNGDSHGNYYKEYKLIEIALVVFLSGKKQKFLRSLELKYRFFNSIRNYYMMLLKKYNNCMAHYQINGLQDGFCGLSHVERNFFGDSYTSLINAFIKADWDFLCECSESKKNLILNFLEENIREFIVASYSSNLVYIKGDVTLLKNSPNIDRSLCDESSDEYYKDDVVYSITKRELCLATEAVIEYFSYNLTVPTICDFYNCKKIFEGSYIDRLHYFECGYKVCTMCIQNNIRNRRTRCVECGTHKIEEDFLNYLSPLFSLKFKPWEEKTEPKYSDLYEELEKNNYIFCIEKQYHLFNELNISFNKTKNRREAIKRLFIEKSRQNDVNKYKFNIDESLSLMIIDWNLEELSRCYSSPFSDDKNRLRSFFYIKKNIESV